MIPASKWNGSGVNPPLPEPNQESRLVFFDGDGIGFANFDAGFTTETLFFVHGNGFAVLKLVHFGGTHVHTFAVAGTFVVVNGNVVAHFFLQKMIWDARTRRAHNDSRVRPEQTGHEFADIFMPALCQDVMTILKTPFQVPPFGGYTPPGTADFLVRPEPDAKSKTCTI